METDSINAAAIPCRPLKIIRKVIEGDKLHKTDVMRKLTRPTIYILS